MKAIVSIVAVGILFGYGLADASDPVTLSSPVAAATTTAAPFVG